MCNSIIKAYMFFLIISLWSLSTLCFIINSRNSWNSLFVHFFLSLCFGIPRFVFTFVNFAPALCSLRLVFHLFYNVRRFQRPQLHFGEFYNLLHIKVFPVNGPGFKAFNLFDDRFGVLFRIRIEFTDIVFGSYIISKNIPVQNAEKSKQRSCSYGGVLYF